MPHPLKESDYIKAWALFALCATVGGFIAGAIVGGILGAILAVAQAPIQVVRLVCAAGGFIAGLPISYGFFRLFVARFIVQKLTIQTVPDSGASGGITQP